MSSRPEATWRQPSDHLHRAASLAVEDRRELPDLVVARPVVDEDAAGAVSVEERRPWPVDEQRHLPSGEIDAVGLAFVDLKEQAAGAPALIHDHVFLDREPARAEHVAAAV